MPAPTLSGDEKQDEKLDVGQADYDRRFNDIVSAEKNGTDMSDFERNYGENADSSKADANIEKARQAEDEGSTGGWKNNTNTPQSKSKKVFALFKKRGSLIGILAVLGVGGGIFTGQLAQFALPINLMENMSISNDSTSTALEKRFMKVFGFATNESDPICQNNTKNMKCRMGRISNKALAQLDKKGLKAYFDDDVTNKDKKTGYPSKNPRGYTIDLGEGKTANVASKDIIGYLVNNPKIASKVLGVKGAFNMRVKAWTGKHITSKLYKPFGMDRKGGIADGKNTKLSPKERSAEALKKLRSKIPGLDKLSGVADGVKKKVEGHLEKSKKGGVGYTIAVAGCIAIKAPGYIAAGVAAVQLAQLIPVANDLILSPGSKLKASGVDVANAATLDDAETVGTVLTNRTARESDGKMTSMLDSKYLQSAIGVNTNKVDLSESFTPGLAILTSPIVAASVQADKAAAPTCNVIMSPAAMYTALAVDAAVTVAASATVIGGVIKVLASLAIGEVVSRVASDVAGQAAKDAIVEFAKNDKIATAEGEALGDVAGISGAAFFSAGGMARNLPTLKTSQLSDVAAMQAETQDFQRKMDVASFSPFDITSRYTFLGGIVYNLNMGAIANGTYNQGLFSSLLNLARLPSSVITPTAGAATNFTENSCGYAAEFGLETANESDTPAINMAGMPCTGLTLDQGNMSTSEAISLIQNEGWLDESKSIPDDATIDSLISSGYIKSETPLTDFIETCSNPTTGDYIFNSAGCTVASSTKSTAEATSCFKDENGEEYCADDSEGYDNVDYEGVKDPKALQAISVFLLDFQAIQSINGEDEGSAASTESQAGATIDMANLYQDSTGVACAVNTIDKGTSTGYTDGTAFGVRICALPNSDEPGKPDGMALVNSRVSGAAYAMFEKMKTDLGVAKIPFGDSFRSPEKQQEAIDDCGLYSEGGCAAAQGYSNHQSGVALDFEYNNTYCVHSRGIVTCPASPYWTWLNAHAGEFGFKSGVDEWWHWSPTGG